MKFICLIIPATVTCLAFTFAQQPDQRTQDIRSTKLATITIPASSLHGGLVPPFQRRYLQKAEPQVQSGTLAGKSGPFPSTFNTRPGQPKIKSNVSLPRALDITATIYDALWVNEVDYDKDGYRQSAQLVWDPDVAGSAGSLDVCEKIYCKVSTSRVWGLVATTATHTITGTTDADKYFLQVYGAAHDFFDWRIDIYRSGQLTPDYSRNPLVDSDLDHYPLETAEEDAIAAIADAWWTNEIDCNGDGFKSSARLVWDPDVVGSTGSLSVHEVISLKLSSDQTWTMYSPTTTHVITGNSSDDQSYLDFTPFFVQHGLFDFKIDIYREGTGTPDNTRDPSNDPDLNDCGIESARDDGLRAKIADVWWSGTVDNDGDGYAQSTRLHWDPDVVGGDGYLFIDCRISCKPSISSQWQVRVDRFSLIKSNTRADADSLSISGMPHGLYDWKIEAYSDWNAAPDVVRQPTNEPLLGAFAMELPEEDGTSAIAETASELPLHYVLMQNYPNPFNPSTIVRYALPVRSVVKLEVFNTLGQLLSTLVSGEIAAGYHEATFHAGGASGFCFCRLEAFPMGNPDRKTVVTRKMAILR